MIPAQADCDPTNPEEHFLWALRNLPNVRGVGQVTHPSILRDWSRHLVDCGFAHRDWLAGLADDNGMIHVDQLPKQVKKFQVAARGPRHDFNPAAGWVPIDEPDPAPVRLPNIHELTAQENAAMLAQYRAAGLIPALPPARDTAEVESPNDNE